MNQLGAASCLVDETHCHNPRFFKATDENGTAICHVTMIPMAAVIGVLVALILCCGGCTGYCCYTLQKQRKLTRMIKEQHEQQLRESIDTIPQPRSDAEFVATPTARSV